MATWAVLSALVLLTDTPAPSVQERIERGKAAIEKLEYEAAVDELVIAADSPTATMQQRVEANLYAGIAHRVLGKDVDAKLNFVFVLKHDPDASLPEGTAPKINNFFELVRQEIELTRAPVQAPPPAATPPTVPPDAGAAPDDGTAKVFVWAGTGLLAAGLIGSATTVAAIAAGELLLATKDTGGGTKELATYAVIVGTGGLVLALAATSVGSGLLLWGMLE